MYIEVSNKTSPIVEGCKDLLEEYGMIMILPRGSMVILLIIESSIVILSIIESSMVILSIIESSIVFP